MDRIKNKSKLNTAIGNCIYGNEELPCTLFYQEDVAFSLYKIVITKEDSKQFVDVSGRTWVLQEEVKDES